MYIYIYNILCVIIFLIQPQVAQPSKPEETYAKAETRAVLSVDWALVVPALPFAQARDHHSPSSQNCPTSRTCSRRHIDWEMFTIQNGSGKFLEASGSSQNPPTIYFGRKRFWLYVLLLHSYNSPFKLPIWAWTSCLLRIFADSAPGVAPGWHQSTWIWKGVRAR